MLSLDRAELLAVLVESLTWGAAANSVFRAYRSMHAVKRSRDRHPKSEDTSYEGNRGTLKIFHFAPYLMFLLATLHLSIDWHRNIYALTSLPTREEAIAFLQNTHHWSYPVKDTTYCLATLVGDAVLMLRAYIIWEGRISIMILPFFCFIGSIVASVFAEYYEFRGHTLFEPPLSLAITADLSLFAANNFLSTALIIIRLWRIQTWSTCITTLPVTKLILETGVIYCLATLTTLILFLNKEPGQIIVLNSIASLIPLLFCTIHITSLDRQKYDSPASPLVRHPPPYRNRRGSCSDSTPSSSFGANMTAVGTRSPV